MRERTRGRGCVRCHPIREEALECKNYIPPWHARSGQSAENQSLGVWHTLCNLLYVPVLKEWLVPWLVKRRMWRYAFVRVAEAGVAIV